MRHFLPNHKSANETRTGLSQQNIQISLFKKQSIRFALNENEIDAHFHDIRCCAMKVLLPNSPKPTRRYVHDILYKHINGFVVTATRQICTEC